MGTDQSAGLPEEVVEAVPPISVSREVSYIGSTCCGKAILANCNGVVIALCPDHSRVRVHGGDFIRVEAVSHG